MIEQAVSASPDQSLISPAQRDGLREQLAYLRASIRSMRAGSFGSPFLSHSANYCAEDKEPAEAAELDAAPGVRHDTSREGNLSPSESSRHTPRPQAFGTSRSIRATRMNLRVREYCADRLRKVRRSNFESQPLLRTSSNIHSLQGSLRRRTIQAEHRKVNDSNAPQDLACAETIATNDHVHSGRIATMSQLSTTIPLATLASQHLTAAFVSDQLDPDQTEISDASHASGLNRNGKQPIMSMKSAASTECEASNPAPPVFGLAELSEAAGVALS